MGADEVEDDDAQPVGGRGRGARAAHPRRGRPRPGALPGRRDHAGHVRLGPAELRRRAAAGPAARPGPGPQRDRRASTARSAQVADDFSAFVFKVQSGMNTAHRDRLAYARVVSGTLRARHGRHPRQHRAAVRDEVRPGGLRPRDDAASRAPSPATSSASSTRRPCGSGTPSTSATPSSTRPVAELRPRALRRPPAPATSAATSSSAAASSSSTRRAWCRCCAPTCAATRTRSSPRSARCSSRSSRTG